MKKGDKLFMRIDSRLGENEFGENDFDEHIDYVKKVASERYFVGGGFVEDLGGMIVFEAKNLEEAKEIAGNDPLMKRNLYKYKLFEWELAVLSNNII